MTRAQEAEERFGLKREVAKLKRLMSKKTNGSQSDEDNKTEGEYEASVTSTTASTITENGKEECNDVTDSGDKDTKEPASPDKLECSEVCI